MVEYRDGSDPSRATRKLLGLVRHSDLVLRRGMTKSLDVYEWFKNNKNGSVDRRSVVVVVLDESRQPCAKWKFKNCLPTKYSGPNLNATSNEYVIEEIIIAVEDVERDEV
jgi:phage tail-like protein